MGQKPIEDTLKNFSLSIRNLYVTTLDEHRISNVILLRDTAETLNSKQGLGQQFKLFLVKVLKISDEKILTQLETDKEKAKAIAKFTNFYKVYEYMYKDVYKETTNSSLTLEGFKKFIADLFLIVGFLAKDQITAYVISDFKNIEGLKKSISGEIDVIVYYIRDKIMGSNDESPIGVLLRVVFTQNNLRSTTQGGKRKQTRKRKQSRKRKHSRKRKQ